MAKYEPALRKAVTRAITQVGLSNLKSTSLFLSNEMRSVSIARAA